MAEKMVGLEEAGVVEKVGDREPEEETEILPLDEVPHDDNLAEHLDRDTLADLAQDLLQKIEEDKGSREQWDSWLAEGIRLSGFSWKDREGGADFEGAATVIHPILGEAATDYWARAMRELMPASGPVRTVVLGDSTEVLRDQSHRIQSWMNYLYTEGMPDAYGEESALQMRLALEGSVFKKIYPDWDNPPLVRSEFVPAECVIVPYEAKNLESSPRVTHKIVESKNDMLRKILGGQYREVELGQPRTLETQTETQDAIDGAHGLEPGVWPESLTNYEIQVDLDEPLGENPDGLALPYLVTVSEELNTVLSIRRNWKEGDPTFKKRQWFVHQKFVEGLGFYGFGLYHLIGDLAKAATGSLRALLDAAMFATMPAGFKQKGGRDSGTKPLSPGEFQSTESTADELAKSFFMPPFREPSPTLFRLLEYLVEGGHRFSRLTDVRVGQAASTGPVGTTMALIEQAESVPSAIMRSQYQRLKKEFRIIADWQKELLPEDLGYPFLTPGGKEWVIAEDFRSQVAIVPVADPTLASVAQRVTQAQTTLQMATQPGSRIDRTEAEKRLLKAMRVEDFDSLFIDEHEVPRLDAVSEDMALLHGKPIRAYPDQDHQAHLMVHQLWFSSLPPEGQQMLQGPYFAHIGEHLAWAFRTQIEQALGMPLPPPPDFHSKEWGEKGGMDPEMENQVSALAAQAAQALAQTMQQQQGQQPPDPELLKAQSEIQRKEMESQSKLQDDQMEREFRIRRELRQEAEDERDAARDEVQLEMEIMQFQGDERRKERESRKKVEVMGARSKQ